MGVKTPWKVIPETTSSVQRSSLTQMLLPLWNQNVDFTVLRVSSPSDGGELLSLDLRFWFSCETVVGSLLY